MSLVVTEVGSFTQAPAPGEAARMAFSLFPVVTLPGHSPPWHLGGFLLLLSHSFTSQ